MTCMTKYIYLKIRTYALEPRSPRILGLIVAQATRVCPISSLKGSGYYSPYFSMARKILTLCLELGQTRKSYTR